MRKLSTILLCLAPRNWPLGGVLAIFATGSLASAQQFAPNQSVPPTASADISATSAQTVPPDEASRPGTASAETGPPKTRLNWEQCVRIALANNPDLQVFRDDVLNSDAVRRGAYSQLYPQIAVSFDATRSYTGAFLGAPESYANQYNGQISLSQTIFNGFLTAGNISQARAQLALAFANLDSQKALTSFDLKTAFAQVIYAQEDVKVAQQVVDVNQSNTRLVKLLYDSGNEDLGSYRLTRAQLDQAIFSYDQAVRNVEVSDDQLVTILGEDLPRPIEAVGTLATGPLPVKPDFHALAVQTPAYFQHRAQVDASAAGITIAQAAFYPSLGFQINANRGGINPLPRQTSASGGFTVSYALFDGGANYFNVRAARASLLASLESLRSGTNDAQLTLAQDFKSLVDAVENERVQQEQLDATSVRYKIAEAEYRNALMSFEDFNNITISYVQALQTMLSTRQSAVNAEATWEQARGLGAIP
jgi:outer membrane protein